MNAGALLADGLAIHIQLDGYDELAQLFVVVSHIGFAAAGTAGTAYFGDAVLVDDDGVAIHN